MLSRVRRALSWTSKSSVASTREHISTDEEEEEGVVMEEEEEPKYYIPAIALTVERIDTFLNTPKRVVV